LTDTLTNANWVDLLIIILLARTSYIGYIQGLTYEIITLLGIVGAVLLTFHNYVYMGEFFHENINLPVDFSNFLSFLILAAGSFFLFRYIRNFFHKFMKFEILYALERYGGLVFGFMRGSVITSLVLIGLVLIPNEYVRTSVKGDSLAGLMFLKIVPVSYEYTIGQFPEYKETQQYRVVEEIMKHKPPEDDIKAHYKTRQKKD